MHAGQIVTLSPQPSNEREIAAGFAFFVPTAPNDLKKEIQSGLLSSIDPNTISRGGIRGSLDDLSALALKPDRESRANACASATAGDVLNLSTGELSSLQGLGGPDDVEKVFRTGLFARYQACRSKGRAGIAPYDRGSGKSRGRRPATRDDGSAKRSIGSRLLASELEGFFRGLQKP